MTRKNNHKKMIYCDLSSNHSFLRKSQKTKNLNNSKVTKYAPIMLLTKMLHKRSFLIIKLRKLGKKYFCLLLTKSLFSTDYHKNHKTQNNQRLNISTKMISRQNTV